MNCRTMSTRVLLREERTERTRDGRKAKGRREGGREGGGWLMSYTGVASVRAR